MSESNPNSETHTAPEGDGEPKWSALLERAQASEQDQRDWLANFFHEQPVAFALLDQILADFSRALKSAAGSGEHLGLREFLRNSPEHRHLSERPTSAGWRDIEALRAQLAAIWEDALRNLQTRLANSPASAYAQEVLARRPSLAAPPATLLEACLAASAVMAQLYDRDPENQDFSAFLGDLPTDPPPASDAPESLDADEPETSSDSVESETNVPPAQPESPPRSGALAEKLALLFPSHLQVMQTIEFRRLFWTANEAALTAFRQLHAVSVHRPVRRNREWGRPVRQFRRPRKRNSWKEAWLGLLRYLRSWFGARPEPPTESEAEPPPLESAPPGEEEFIEPQEDIAWKAPELEKIPRETPNRESWDALYAAHARFLTDGEALRNARQMLDFRKNAIITALGRFEATCGGYPTPNPDQPPECNDRLGEAKGEAFESQRILELAAEVHQRIAALPTALSNRLSAVTSPTRLTLRRKGAAPN